MNGWVGVTILFAVFLGACVAGVGDPGAPEPERAPVAVIVTTTIGATP